MRLFKSKKQKELENKQIKEKEEENRIKEEENRIKENAFREIYCNISNLVLPKIVETINFEEISKCPIEHLRDIRDNKDKIDEIMINDNWVITSNRAYGKYFCVEESKEYDALIDEFIEKNNNGSINKIYMDIEYQYKFENYVYYMLISFFPNVTFDLESHKLKKDDYCDVKLTFLRKTQIINI